MSLSQGLRIGARLVVAMTLCLCAFLCATVFGAEAQQGDFSAVPGTVIHHSPATSKIYIGSPGIVRLPNGDYLTKCDEFGPNSTEGTSAVTRVFRSQDQGKTWRQVAKLNDMYWATIFVHRDAVYLIGTTSEYGRIVTMRSTDHGASWTTPKDANSGLLLEGQYHCAPVPVVIHNGRLWRAFEEAPGGKRKFRVVMMSAPVESDLLQAASWTSSNHLPADTAWLDGNFREWLEGNAIVTPQGEIVDLLRVGGPLGRLAALVHISPDGKTATFDPATDFVDFPGGAKKFTVRYDETTKQYWSLTNYVLPEDRSTEPGRVRNTLALIASPDLQNWEVKSIVLHHPDTEKHGFQYVDWEFEGDDLIAACRTAFDDGLGGARNQHDANFLTFHRVSNFRNLTRADDVTGHAKSLPK